MLGFPQRRRDQEGFFADMCHVVRLRIFSHSSHSHAVMYVHLYSSVCSTTLVFGEDAVASVIGRINAEDVGQNEQISYKQIPSL